MSSAAPRIRVGVLGRPFGLSGGIRCALDGEPVPTVAVPCDGWIGYSASYLEAVRLERCDRRPDDLICYFAGVGSSEETAKLIDKALYLLPESISYGSPFVHPLLVGYEVIDEVGTILGQIISLMSTPAHPIWLIRSSNAHEWMLPAVEEFIISVDNDRRQVVIRPIAGMIEEEANNSNGR